MKQILLYFILIISSFPLLAQSDVFHRVKINCDYVNIENIQKLGLHIDYIHNHEYYILEISGDELQILNNSGIKYKIEISDIGTFYRQRNQGKDPATILNAYRNKKDFDVPENFTLGSMGGFCTYSEILAHLDTMYAKFPNLITQKDTAPGQSYQGRPIYWLRISDNPTVDEDEPEVFYNSLIHAREPGSMQQMLYFMYYVLENYETDPEIKRLVDNFELYFIPCINPDGYIYNEQHFPNGGGMWRKNRRTNYNNSVGVDLNRNFSYKWGYDNMGSSPNPVSSTYRGEEAFSEQETTTIKNFAELHDFKITLNYHTYKNMLLHSWGYSASASAPDYYHIRYMASLITQQNRYDFGPTSKLLYLTNGDAADWFYGEQITKPRGIAYTVEVGTAQDGFWPPIERIIPQCQECLPMNIMTAKIAGSYSEIIDHGSINISQHTGYLSFGIKRVGLTDAPITISVQPLNDAFEYLENEKVFSTIPTMETAIDSVSYIIKSGMIPGNKIQYVITAQNEYFITQDTITKIFGSDIILFNDPCDSLQNWASDEWAARSNQFHSPSKSLSNVAGSYYPNNSSSSINLIDSIITTQTQSICINYFAKWDLDGGRDYIKFVYSDDNRESWHPVAGRYSSMVFDGEQIIPVYEGKSSIWVNEWILIEDVNSTPIWFGFQFTSNHKIGRSGFYFDDFKVLTVDMQTQEQQITIPQGWSGISAFLIPKNPDINELFDESITYLEFLNNETSFYQPGNTNSNLSTWNSSYGYIIKASENFTLSMDGYPENNNSLSLNQGWNLIPIISAQPINVNLLTTEPANEILVIKEACGVKVFWPEKNSFSLQQLQPGNSYFIKLGNDAVLTFD